MSAMLPPSRPRATTDEFLLALRTQHGVTVDREKFPIFVGGVRGYYRDSMGKPGANDRMIYDDAIVLVTPNVVAWFNGNTDPGAFRADIASLKPGWYESYRLDMHNGKYMALCQRAGDVIVYRDGTENVPAGTLDARGRCLGRGFWQGMFGINVHRGGNTVVSSLGCQTIPPKQWDVFYALLEAEAKRVFGARWRKAVIPYGLIEGPLR